MPITICVTLLFLLSSGAPARHALASCTTGYIQSGDQQGARGDDLLVIDSRGATILTVPGPMTIACHAEQGREHWSGSVQLTRHGQHIPIRLHR